MRKNLITNSAYSTFSYVFSAICQIFIYAYASNVLGSKNFAQWSYLYSVANVAGISNVGMPNLIIEECGNCIKENKINKVGLFFFNCIILFLFSFPLIALLIIGFLNFSLASLQLQVSTIYVLLVCVLVFFFQNIAALSSSLADGLQLIKKRSFIQISSNFFFLFVAFILLQQSSVINLLIAQLVFYITQSILLLHLCKKTIDANNNITKYFVSKNMLFSIFNRSKVYMSTSVSYMFYEPLVRFFLGKLVGNYAIASYEMITRVVFGVKNIFIATCQVLFPIFSVAKEKIYKPVFDITNSILPITILVFSVLPIFFFYYSTYINVQLNMQSTILLFATIISSIVNIISAPSYFFLLAYGYNKMNFISHLINLILLIIISVLSYISNSVFLALTASSISIVISSAATIILLSNKYKLYNVLTLTNYAIMIVVAFLFFNYYILFLVSNLVFFKITVMVLFIILFFVCYKQITFSLSLYKKLRKKNV